MTLDNLITNISVEDFLTKEKSFFHIHNIKMELINPKRVSVFGAGA